jgi:cytochrome c
MRFLSLLVLCALNLSAAESTPNEFRKVVLAQGLNDPMELSVAKDGRVFFIERGGAVKIWKPDTKSTVEAAKLKVFFNYNEGVEAANEGKKGGWEDGLLGIHLDPNFERTQAVYLYYSPVDVPENWVSRFELKGDKLDLASEKVILKVPTQREVCCHSGGSLEFDAEGNLYLSCAVVKRQSAQRRRAFGAAA